VSLQSSVLAAAAYLEGAQTLYLRFQSGEVYRYFEFPPEQYSELLAAESRGRYFAAKIRDRFRCERVSRLQRSADASI
jgi:hypothetical protein